MRPTNIGLIMSRVAGFYRVPPHHMTSPMRQKHIAHARLVAMYLMRKLTSLSLHNIGDYFDRDHTCVINARKKITRRIAEDPAFAEEIACVERFVIREQAKQEEAA